MSSAAMSSAAVARLRTKGSARVSPKAATSSYQPSGLSHRTHVPSTAPTPRTR